MPPTTTYSFGDIVLVPFPFADQSGAKKRPAVVVSSAAYHAQRRDVIIMAVTSQVRPTLGFGELLVNEWKKAGLLKPSVVKPLVATIEKGLILFRLGQLQDPDPKTLRGALRAILG